MGKAPREIFVWPKGEPGAEWPSNRSVIVEGYDGPCHWMGVHTVRYVRADLVDDKSEVHTEAAAEINRLRTENTVLKDHNRRMSKQLADYGMEPQDG